MLRQHGTLVGKIKESHSLSGKLRDSGNLCGTILLRQCRMLVGKMKKEHSLSATLKFSGNLCGVVSMSATYKDECVYYDGEYEVIPKVSEQTLYTKDKHMNENVEIKGIPIYSTSNNSGGNTVYIAKEVE